MRRSSVLVAASMVLAGLGLVLAILGFWGRSGPPAPASAASSTASSGESVAGPVAAALPAPTTSAEPVTPAPELRQRPGPGSSPVALALPSIGVSTPVNSVGLNPDRTLEVPAPGPLYDQAAWYRGSPTPGRVGPSVIIGHVDSASGGPSVFYDLGRLRPGERVTVTLADGSERTFAVDTVRRVPKDAFPSLEIYGDTAGPELRLITCGGPFDAAQRSYEDNTVIFASVVP